MIKLIKEFSQDQMKWRNQPEIWPFVRQQGPITLAHHLKWQEQALEGEYFGLEVHEESRLKGLVKKPVIVGYCGLDKIRDRAAEYSILIGPEHQGKGYAQEGLSELLTYAFLTLGLEVVWGEIIEGNNAGLHIAEKLGFVREGTLRARYFKKGARTNSVMVSILAKEWKK